MLKKIKPKKYAVKLIETRTSKDLQSQVNDFAECLDDFQLIDVKYKHAFAVDAVGCEYEKFSALIFYTGIREDYSKEGEENDAIQITETKSLDVYEQTEDGEGMGKRNSQE